MIFHQLFRDTNDEKEGSIRGKSLGRKRKSGNAQGASLDDHQKRGRLDGSSFPPERQKGGMIYGEEGTNENE